jgi:hypothetical protein
MLADFTYETAKKTPAAETVNAAKKLLIKLSKDCAK